MGLLSFLKRNRTDDAPAADKAASADEVQRARTRARQRLIGAVVLLAVGVIAFPLVFETQPRPIAVDIPIEIPRKDNAAPLTPPPRTKPPARADAAASAAVAASAPEDSKPTAVAAAPAPVVPPVPASVPASKPVAAPAVARTSPDAVREKDPVKPPATAPVAVDAARAKALLEDKPAAAVRTAEVAGRFVVQVGAFAEAGAAREARAKVEKLGLKSYTQEVDTGGGKRIRVRVGPFATRDEADKAAGRIKSAGMPTAVLGL